MDQLEFEFVKEIQSICPAIPNTYRFIKEIQSICPALPNTHRLDLDEKESVSPELEKYLNLDRSSFKYKLYNKYLDVKFYIKNIFQKYRYGVNDAECYRLYNTIAEFILPRLIHFKQMNRYSSCPVELTHEEWECIIDESIWAFDYIINEEKYLPYPPIKWDWENGTDKNYLNREKTSEEIIIWNNYYKNMNELNARKEKALSQFAKYFEGFWN